MGESLADMVLSFFEEESAAGSSGSDDGWTSDSNEVEAGGGRSADAVAFWQSQEQLLQDALMAAAGSSSERRIRVEMEAAVSNMRAEGADACTCYSGGGGGGGSVGIDCRRGCVLRGIADRLREKGYDSAACRSKWRKSPDIPSGEHSYIEILLVSRSGQRDPSRIVVEPSFRAEFQVARGSREYNTLVSRLPEMFVGKAERLRTVVKIMCRAAKRCMKQNQMHMGPWRKPEYMLSKWLGSCERFAVSLPPVEASRASNSGATRVPRPRASMLTFDLHRTAVQVV